MVSLERIPWRGSQGGGRGGGLGFIGCLCSETDWIIAKVDKVVSNLWLTLSGVTSERLWIERMDHKECWWDLLWIGTSRSEFKITQVDRCPLLHFKTIKPVFSIAKDIHLVH